MSETNFQPNYLVKEQRSVVDESRTRDSRYINALIRIQQCLTICVGREKDLQDSCRWLCDMLEASTGLLACALLATQMPKTRYCTWNNHFKVLHARWWHPVTGLLISL